MLNLLVENRMHKGKVNLLSVSTGGNFASRIYRLDSSAKRPLLRKFCSVWQTPAVLQRSAYGREFESSHTMYPTSIIWRASSYWEVSYKYLVLKLDQILRKGGTHQAQFPISSTN